MAQVTLAYVGMGSNMGDPVQNLINAEQLINRSLSNVASRNSCLYFSSPVGFDHQPFFVNRVLEVSTLADIDEFFAHLQTIELQLGRVRDSNNQNAPRIIDLDLLLFGELESDQDKLTVPHPRMLDRLFVVEPLIELNDQLTLPSGRYLSDLVQSQKKSGHYDGQTLYQLC